MNRSNIGDNLGFRRDIGIMFERYPQYNSKNRFKLQGDYTWQDEAVKDLDNNFWKLQLQALF